MSKKYGNKKALQQNRETSTKNTKIIKRITTKCQTAKQKRARPQEKFFI